MPSARCRLAVAALLCASTAHDADGTSAQNLESIRAAYNRRFGQESVIRSNQIADVDF